MLAIGKSYYDKPYLITVKNTYEPVMTKKKADLPADI